jgi:hypothetical protein
MKIELTIKTDYLPSWGVWQGLRELVQNARDAQLEMGAPMSVDWHNDTLRIENEGTTLPHEALLLGHTTKIGREELIGKFGEGLKLGILALVRAGFPVKIRSGSEVWVPTIQRSEKFNADVLVFDVTGGRKAEDRVRVEIQGISKETWDGSKWKFRFLGKEGDDVVSTSGGSLLLDEKMKGHVFVKGIYVSTDPKLEYGYDLARGDLDRDRKMVDQYDFMFRARDILGEANAKRPDLLSGFIAALEKQTPDVRGIDATMHYTIPTQVKEAVAADFKTKHGPDAVPVRTLGESKDLDHLGKRGIVVSESLAGILSSTMPSPESVKQALKEETLTKYGWSDLTEAERTSLDEAITLVNGSGVTTTSLDVIDVADFRSKELLGLYKGGRIVISRKLLADRTRTLSTLVHEVAHSAGDDGAKDHVATIEAIWSGIVSSLRSKP